MRMTIANAKAIKYACLKFHYAKVVPVVKYGYNIYNDDDEWCGVIVYGSGANSLLGHEFGFVQGEVLELVRVALNGKQLCTSQCVAMSLKQVHKDAPHVKAIISYADIDQNHKGIIYQATNWLYFGKLERTGAAAFIINGKKVHPRHLYSKGIRQNIETVRRCIDKNAEVFLTKGKHKYVYVFDKRLRKEFAKKALPYPKE